ncbi:MAG: hypothetical protein HEQ27_00820 [Dolichospermum sp. JUN01]|nr:hypothetical protein [Dolichospermum sp. JUN01]
MSVRFWGCWEYDRCLGMWRGAIAISGMLGSAIAVWDVGRAIAFWRCDAIAKRCCKQFAFGYFDTPRSKDAGILHSLTRR